MSGKRGNLGIALPETSDAGIQCHQVSNKQAPVQYAGKTGASPDADRRGLQGKPPILQRGLIL